MNLRSGNDRGFSALELLFVVAIVAAMAAIGLPLSTNMITDIKLRGDAQAISSAVALTKLTSSAQFTHARLFVNTTAGTYRIETWNRTGTPGWVALGADMRLSDRSTFGAGSVTAPPPSSQAVLAQPPTCRDDQDVPISSTACVIFTSRGLSVLSTGLPATTEVLYLNSAAGVYAITVGATGRLQVWRTKSGASAWRQQ